MIYRCQLAAQNRLVLAKTYSHPFRFSILGFILHYTPRQQLSSAWHCDFRHRSSVPESMEFKAPLFLLRYQRTFCYKRMLRGMLTNNFVVFSSEKHYISEKWKTATSNFITLGPSISWTTELTWNLWAVSGITTFSSSSCWRVKTIKIRNIVTKGNLVCSEDSDSLDTSDSHQKD